MASGCFGEGGKAVIEWSYQVTHKVEKEEILLASHAFKL